MDRVYDRYGSRMHHVGAGAGYHGLGDKPAFPLFRGGDE
jgi:hypothetical protein